MASNCNQRIAYPYGGKYCCVVGCNNSQYRDNVRGVKFHSFPKDEERKKLWILAVNRVDPKKRHKLWHPKTSDVICSEHFAGGKKSNVKESASYIPSVFPTNHLKPQLCDDTPRANRRKKFESIRDSQVKYNSTIQYQILSPHRKYLSDKKSFSSILLARSDHIFYNFFVRISVQEKPSEKLFHRGFFSENCNIPNNCQK